MPKAIAQLFRDPESAQKAVGQLLAHGYKAEEIGLLLSRREGRRLMSLVGVASAQLTLPQVGEVTAVGALARHLGQLGTPDDVSKALAQLLGATPETYAYYEFGFTIGGVLLTVHGEEAHLQQALRLLRSATSGALPVGKRVPNSGFNSAARMTATDPLDAKMTGDFRRY